MFTAIIHNLVDHLGYTFLQLQEKIISKKSRPYWYSYDLFVELKGSHKRYAKELRIHDPWIET